MQSTARYRKHALSKGQILRRTIFAFADKNFLRRSRVVRIGRQTWLHAGDEHGFTLIELLVVIAILGLLITLVAPAMIRQLGSAKHKIAEQSVERLTGILDLYRLDVGTYPTTEQGLTSLIAAPSGITGWDGPYLKDPNGVRDPWGRPFEYRSPSQRTGRPFDISSLGADGKSGGEGEDADILNR